MVGRRANICCARIVVRSKTQITSGVASFHSGRHRRLRRLLTPLIIVIVVDWGTPAAVIYNHVVRRDDIVVGHVRLTVKGALATAELRILHG